MPISPFLTRRYREMVEHRVRHDNGISQHVLKLGREPTQAAAAQNDLNEIIDGSARASDLIANID